MKAGEKLTLSMLQWSRYPVRVCRSLHHCEFCDQSILDGERYLDGGYSRRAHESCFQQANAQPVPASLEDQPR